MRKMFLTLLCGMLLACSGKYFESKSDMLNKWKILEEKYHDSNRHDRIRPILQNMSGVYSKPVNFGANINERLNNSILMTVIELGDFFDPLSKYYQYLFNFLCFCKTFNHRLLIFAVSRNSSIADQSRDFLQSFYSEVELLDYPHELFWQTLRQKDTNVFGGRGRADYESDFPTFRKFGGLVKMVPVLEVLEMGFNPIFYDVDIAYLEDPIPYLLRGDADFVFTPELRNCLFPSLYEAGNWDRIEPNTGTFFIRSSSITIAKVRRSLRLQVVTNSNSEQPCFLFKDEENATWTKSCDPAFDFFPRHLREQFPVSSDIEIARREGFAMSYCFVSEFAFHTGAVEMGCAKGRHWVNRQVYDLAMASMALPYPHLSFQNGSISLDQNAPFSQILPTHRRRASFWKNDTLPYLYHSSTNQTARHHQFFYPHYVQLHTNYCGHKWRCLSERQLWLYHKTVTNASNNIVHMHISRRRLTQSMLANNNHVDHSQPVSISIPPGLHDALPEGGKLTHSCHAFRPEKTPYATYNWTAAYMEAVNKFDAFWQQHQLNNVTIVKFVSQPFLYFVEYLDTGISDASMKRDLLLRLIHNDTVLSAYGWSQHSVTTIGDPMFLLLPFGDPVSYPPPLRKSFVPH